MNETQREAGEGRILNGTMKRNMDEAERVKAY